jgi:hypothetical protein
MIVDLYIMRDILDKLTDLTESVGLANRKPGEVFVNDRGNEIRFQQVDFYPQGGGQYQNAQQLQQAMDEVIEIMGVLPQHVNAYNPRYLSFGVAQFVDSRGKLMAFLKFYPSVKADPKANAWDNQTGLPGYKYRSQAATKTQSSATPQDILTQLDDLTAQDIVQQVSAKFPNSSLVTVTEHIARGGELPYTFDAPAEMSISAFQDYFCELLQPMALQTGQYTGEADDAAQVFLPGTGFADTLISFGKTKTEGLSDSILTAPDGRRLKVSSKGGSGAAASSRNILDAYNELRNNPKNKKLLKSLEDTITLIETMVEAGQHGAPLELAEQYGIISSKDRDWITAVRGFRPVPLTSLKDVSVAGKEPSRNLVKLANSRTTKTPESVNLYFHLMAAVAQEVVDYVNEHTSFGKDAAVILNHSALIQMYSMVTASGNKWTLKKFTTKWPGSLVTGVALDAKKNYMSTNIKGNFTFVLNPTKQDLSAADDVEEPTDTEEPDQKKTRLVGPGVRAARAAAAKDTPQVLGRQRRR